MAQGDIEIVISKKDGNTKVETKGFKGQQCVGQADDILNALGGAVKTTRKREFYREQDVRVRDSH
tara:strand:- start:8205 stop:8399 length:195 start_codon:yes stop_codon:yes gene_type:complete